MARLDPTCIGFVREVLGSTLTVTIDSSLAGVAPIFEGRLQRIGQIGSIVRIPQGLVDLVGQVALLGIEAAEAAGNRQERANPDERWLHVELLGEINRTTHIFTRGVGTYPGLQDPVHFATPADLRSIFPDANEKAIQIGRLSASEEIPICLDVQKLVTRHSVVVGSTGAGKTSCVATILQSFAEGGWEAANVVVVDPHGEYSTALPEHASVKSVLGEGPNELRVPYWAMPASEILFAFTGAKGSGTTATRFQELVMEERRASFYESTSKWLNLDPNAITADTPIPFELRKVWHQLDYENNETRTVKSNPSTSTIQSVGDPDTLTPTVFETYGPGGESPFKGPYHGLHGTIPELLRLGLKDPRRSFLLGPVAEDSNTDPLVREIANWLGNEQPISILDFGGVPSEASELAIAVILGLLFETAVHAPESGTGIGRTNPVLIVLEEAHRFVNDSSNYLVRNAINRIAREGRKYGVGLMLVTQRPSELPDTALSQSGTIIALRLSNLGDQSLVRGALPDSVSGLADVLPSLRTGEAVVTGEAVQLPVRALLNLPNPVPNAEDPSLEAWRNSSSGLQLDESLALWRGVYSKE